MRGSEFADVAEQFAVIVRTSGWIHGQSMVDRVGSLCRVPRVDDQRAVQGMGRTGKFGQNQNAMTVLLAGNVLVCDLGRMRFRSDFDSVHAPFNRKLPLTRFMPSRVDVINAASLTRYSAVNSSKGILLCMK